MGSNESKTAQENDPEDKLAILKKQLKINYASWYKFIFPNPFVRQVTTSVDKVYVDNKMTVIYKDIKTGEAEQKVWHLINSYQDVFKIEDWKSFEWIVIEGESGYGKSLLTLKLAYDWCNGEDPLKNVDLFILIRLKEMNGVNSLYDGLWKSLLLKRSLSAENIEDVINRDDISGVLVLDGLEDYNEMHESISDFHKVFTGTKLGTFRVIITTNGATRELLPNKSNVLRLRLCGFDLQTQKMYLSKVLENKFLQPPNPSEVINSRLEKDFVVADILQIPLIFVMYVYMRPDVNDSISVTQFFKYLTSKFFEHYGRMNSKEENQSQLAKLSKFSLQRLCDVNTSSLWRKDVIVKNTKSACYEPYIKAGILREECDLHLASQNGDGQGDSMKSRIRFLHSAFQEWYSARHLVHLANKGNFTKLEKYAGYLHPIKHQLVFRFACGMDHGTGSAILKYLNRRLLEDISTEAESQIRIILMFCIMEMKTEDVKNSLQEIMDDIFEFHMPDSILFQRSQVQALRMASDLEIPVTKVKIDSCFGCIDTRNTEEPHSSTEVNKYIILTSGQNIPSFSHVLVNLSFTFLGKVVSSDEAATILGYAFACPHLNSLEFYGGVLPMQLECNRMNSRKFTVTWVATTVQGSTTYKLNFKSGKWENRRRQLTIKKYARLEQAQLGKLLEPVRRRKAVVKKASGSRSYPPSKKKTILRPNKKKKSFGYPASPLSPTKAKSFKFN